MRTWAVAICILIATLLLVRSWLSHAPTIEKTRHTDDRRDDPDYPYGNCKKPRKTEKDVFTGLGTLEYCEGNHGLAFTWEPRGEKGERFVLEVPSTERWPKDFPDWAHGRRDEILGNIKRITSARGWNFEFRDY
jgi:hypothetical protein